MRARVFVGSALLAALVACGASSPATPHGPVVEGSPTDEGHVASPPDAGSSKPAGDASLDGATTPGDIPLGATVVPGGVTFRVWAPHASNVAVSGDFNAWSPTASPLAAQGDGTFAAMIPGARAGQGYAFAITQGATTKTKADPRARKVEGSKGHSVIVDPAAFPWTVEDFHPPPVEKQVVYEMHIGTFNAPTPGVPGTWAQAIDKLDHLATLGVNMLEVMPPAEFAGDYSWGYNTAFPFAPETAYGTDDDMRRFVDAAHARGMGVIIDIVDNHWGPSDLPMTCYDGDCLGAQGIYFYTDARAKTPWGPRPDFSRPEVRDYIRDSAVMWLTEMRCDGLRWDSVSNIRAINLVANPDGVTLLRDSMDAIHRLPDKLMIAEDLYTVDAVTQKTSTAGGLGFDTQWDAAFFHPIDDNTTTASDADRKMSAIKDAITHTYNGHPMERVIYSEDHDEVANNGRARIPQMISPSDPGSLIARKRSTLAATIVLTSPGIPMLFMGQEFLEDGSFGDKNPLDWSKVTTYAPILKMYEDLVALRKNADGDALGLQGDGVNVFHVNDGAKVIAYHRWKNGGVGDDVVVIVNYANKVFTKYQLGVPHAGTWHTRFNSDATRYSADFGNTPSGDLTTSATAYDGFAQSIVVQLGAYSALVLSQ